MADLVLFDRSIELFEFDWCQCPLDVLNKLKTNSLLKFFLWGTNKFLIVDIDNKVTKNVQQTISDLKQEYSTHHIILISQTNYPNFFSNYEFSILQHMYYIVDPTRCRVLKNTFAVSRKRDTFFTIVSGDAVACSNDTSIDIVEASVSDLYQIYSASSANLGEYIGDVNQCFFADDYSKLLTRFKKHRILVFKYMNQVFGFMEYSIEPDEVTVRLETSPLYEQKLRVCCIHYTCSFSRWKRLRQEQEFRRIGKDLWNKVLEEVTHSFPDSYILVYLEALDTAIPFHRGNHMLLNKEVPLLQFLQKKVNGALEPFLPYDDVLELDYMYYIVAGVNLPKLEGGHVKNNELDFQIWSNARRSPGRRFPGRRSPSRRSHGKRSPGRRSPGKRSPSRRSRGRRSPGRRSPSRRSRGRRSPGRRSPSRRSPFRRSPGRRSPGRRSRGRRVFKQKKNKKY